MVPAIGLATGRIDPEVRKIGEHFGLLLSVGEMPLAEGPPGELEDRIAARLQHLGDGIDREHAQREQRKPGAVASAVEDMGEGRRADIADGAGRDDQIDVGEQGVLLAGRRFVLEVAGEKGVEDAGLAGIADGALCRIEPDEGEIAVVALTSARSRAIRSRRESAPVAVTP